MLSPNPYVLEAQARVCTGPHQSRPLGLKPGDPLQPARVIELILASLRGDLRDEPAVSTAQMGALFTAMTLRRDFTGPAAYNDAERHAFAELDEALREQLPDRLRWIYQPDGPLPAGSKNEAKVLSALRVVLQGKHPSYAQTRSALDAILDGEVCDSLSAALLIGQRMNLESEEETRAYLDAVFGDDEATTVVVDELLHIGDPYNGSNRSFRPTLFVGAVHAALGCATVLHGVDQLPPKLGVTEEQLLLQLGARTDLRPAEAKACLEDPSIGLAYLSQRVFSPGAYRLAELRMHIKKRPVLATTEKAQRLFRTAANNYMIVGYFHSGYEKRLLRLIRQRGFDAGLVIKGQEGTSHCSLHQRYDHDAPLMNHCHWYRAESAETREGESHIDPSPLGYDYAHHPRLDTVTPALTVQLGTEALGGTPGSAYDSIALSATVQRYHLGLVPTLEVAREQVLTVMNNGKALRHLRAYLQAVAVS